MQRVTEKPPRSVVAARPRFGMIRRRRFVIVC
jgi:hypothetical protein